METASVTAFIDTKAVGKMRLGTRKHPQLPEIAFAGFHKWCKITMTLYSLCCRVCRTLHNAWKQTIPVVQHWLSLCKPEKGERSQWTRKQNWEQIWLWFHSNLTPITLKVTQSPENIHELLERIIWLKHVLCNASSCPSARCGRVCWHWGDWLAPPS